MKYSESSDRASYRNISVSFKLAGLFKELYELGKAFKRINPERQLRP